jgi:hypothetical protein
MGSFRATEGSCKNFKNILGGLTSNKKIKSLSLPSYPCYTPKVLLAPRDNTGPNVLPLSVLTLSTDSLLVAFTLSHHVSITLSPSVAISAFIESVSLILLRLILSPKVAPLSFDALKITSPFEFGVP